MQRWSPGILGGLILVVVVWLIPGVERNEAPRNGWAMARHLLRAGLSGDGAGTWDPKLRNPVIWADLLPGDILVARAPGSVYGTWSHAAIALGDGRIIDHGITFGLVEGDLRLYAGYAEVLVLRPDADDAQRAVVVAATRAQIGRPFNLGAHPEDPWQWTCSKAVVAAWAEAGVVVDDGRFWITPDALAAGPVRQRLLFRAVE